MSRWIIRSKRYKWISPFCDLVTDICDPGRGDRSRSSGSQPHGTGWPEQGDCVTWCNFPRDVITRNFTRQLWSSRLEQNCNEPVQCSCLMELLTGLSLVVADTSDLKRYRGLWPDDARSMSRAWSHYWRAWHLWALAIALLTSSPDRTWHWTDETLTQTGLRVSECCRGGHRGIMGPAFLCLSIDARVLATDMNGSF